jgi:hypothetical protein
MIVVFNLKGLGFLALGIAIGFGAIALVPAVNGPPFHLIAGGILFLSDLAYRVRVLRPLSRPASANPEPIQPAGSGLNVNLSEHWLTTSRGGSLMFLPAWAFALAYLALLLLVARG